MGKQRIKVRKKDSEKAEEILSFTQRMADWIVANLKLVIGVSIGVVLVLLASWGYNSYAQSKQRRALKDYAQARARLETLKTANKADYDAAIKAIGAIARQYQGTKIGALARMDLGRLCFDARRYQDAVKWYESARETLAHEEVLADLATYYQALAYRELGKLDRALELLKSIEERFPTRLQREFHWQVAQIYLAQGEYAKAVEQLDLAAQAPGTYPAKPQIEQERLMAKAAVRTPAS